MNALKKVQLILLLITVILIFIIEAIKHGDTSPQKDTVTYCSDHYCTSVPKDVIVVNRRNWREHRGLIPEEIQAKFLKGSSRELWIFTKENNITVAVEYKNGRVRIDHPDSYCETIQEKLGERLTDCGHVFEYKALRGLQTISFKGKGALSFIRIFMPLNGGSVYFVCAGRWDNEYVVRKTYQRVRRIIASMRIKQ